MARSLFSAPPIRLVAAVALLAGLAFTGLPSDQVTAAPAEKDVLDIWVNAFIPKDISGLTKPVPGGKGKTMISGPTPANDCFLTDQRGFSSDSKAKSRMHHFVSLDFSTGKVVEKKRCDPTVEVDCEDGEVECTEKADTKGMKSKVTRSDGGRFTIRFVGEANNPCFTGSPDIDWDLTLTVRLSEDGSKITIQPAGKVEPFPAFEMYARHGSGKPKKLYTRMPTKGKSPGDLYGSANEKVEAKPVTLPRR